MHMNHLLRELLEHREKPQVTFISLSFTHSFIEIHTHTHIYRYVYRRTCYVSDIVLRPGGKILNQVDYFPALLDDTQINKEI